MTTHTVDCTPNYVEAGSRLGCRARDGAPVNATLLRAAALCAIEGHRYRVSWVDESYHESSPLAYTEEGVRFGPLAVFIARPRPFDPPDGPEPLYLAVPTDSPYGRTVNITRVPPDSPAARLMQAHFPTHRLATLGAAKGALT